MNVRAAYIAIGVKAWESILEWSKTLCDDDAEFIATVRLSAQYTTMCSVANVSYDWIQMVDGGFTRWIQEQRASVPFPSSDDNSQEALSAYVNSDRKWNEIERQWEEALVDWTRTVILA